MLASSTVAFGMRIIIVKFLDSREDRAVIDESSEAPGMIPYRIPRYFTEPLGFRTAAAVMGSVCRGYYQNCFWRILIL